MSDNHDRLVQFINSLGFKIRRDERNPEFFGNYIIEGCRSQLCVAGVRDRSVESIELRGANEVNNWYDMNIIVSALGEEDKLREPLSLEYQMRFLETHLDQIAELFTGEHLQRSKAKFKQLMDRRARENFPEWYK